jgi:serine protein kinase
MNERSRVSPTEVLEFIHNVSKLDFDSNRRILSFEEYLALLAEQPADQLRGSAKYVADMMDHFGKTQLKNQPDPSVSVRFNVFDLPIEGACSKVVGQERVQNDIYNALKTFHHQGFNNKLLLLHGPNGSAKTSLIHSMMTGLERYSHEPEGAVYAFNWIFPVERMTKGNIGLGGSRTKKEEAVSSYAKISDEDTLSRIPCDLRDHPLLLIPIEQRKSFLEKLISPKKADEIWNTLPNYLKKGDLCHRCKQIFEALLAANNGDFRKVLSHIQIERAYLSRRYRKGLVTVEPQLHVDAQYHQLTYNKSIGSLPPSLQSLNLFTLTGDYIAGSRGIIEYSDLLKRPVDTFKYLLIACETGAVNVSESIAYVDAVMLGSTNEVQLDAFKEFPDFTSFKARIELIRVPYLLSSSQEQQIYETDLENIGATKHVAPHVSWVLGLWAVLTRLKKPNSINYPPSVSTIVSSLTPIEKARLYDSGEMPGHLSPEDRKILRSNFKKLRDEHSIMSMYEGRMGASAREMKSLLFAAAQNSEFGCLSPLAIFREMEELVKHITEYEFLRQDVKDGYHDTTEFINTVKTEYLAKIDREVRDSIGLYDSKQWEDFLKKYVQHISHVLKKEKVKNPITGKMQDPDHTLIAEFEKIVEAPTDASARDSFRQNIISQVGAWSLDHPKETVMYGKVFPEFWAKLEKHYFETQKNLLTKMHNALLVYGDKDTNISDEGAKLAYQTVENMKLKLGYCDHCAKEVITFLMRQKY